MQVERDSAWVHVLDPWSKHEGDEDSTDESQTTENSAAVHELKQSHLALESKVDKLTAILERIESKLSAK